MLRIGDVKVTWLFENREWVFSGIGILSITTIFGFLKKKSNNKQHQQSIKSGKNSTNIQNSRDVRVRNGRIDNEK